MNLILLEEAQRVLGRGEQAGEGNDVFRLEGTQANHIREVLRSKSGDTLEVGLLEGPFGTGRVLSVDETSAYLACTFENTTPERGRFDVALAVPRPKMLRRILFAAGEIGVDRLVLFRSWRVERSYLDSQALSQEACVPHLKEGLMQGRGTRLPRVIFVPTFREFLADRLPTLQAPRYVLHPGDGPWLRASASGKGTLVLGPEGGLIPREVESLTREGCALATLGTRILRVETAFVYALAALGSSEYQASKPG